MVRYEYDARNGLRFTFREPVKGDAKGLMSFINSIVSEPMSGILMNKKVSLKAEEAWLSGRLEEVRRRTTVMLLVERDGRVVGNCHLFRLPGKHAHRASLGVALRREARGMGVGEAVIRRTIELGLSRFKGLEAIDLSAFAYNDRAQSLYKKLGFEEYGRVPRSSKEGDRYYDEVLMQLPVPSAGGGKAPGGVR